MNENKEIWKDIDGYEGLYRVSNLGRVKSLKQGKEKILKQVLVNNYLAISLYKNNEKKLCKVHRLVCQTFLLNPQNLPQVNHKDENKTNNKVDNLEWCDVKYNNNYGTRTQRANEKNTNGKCSKTVLQYSKDGEFIRQWKSTKDVERNLGYGHSQISACCRGKYKSSYEFVWKYK